MLFLNQAAMQFDALPYVKFLIYVLIVIIAIICIVNLFKIKSPLKGKGVTRELDHMREVRRYDQSIIRKNKAIYNINKFIESTPLKLDKATKEYWQYNIDRLGLKTPGNTRDLLAEELHSLITFGNLLLMGISILIMVLGNMAYGAVLALTVVILGGTLPSMIIRAKVKERDDEIVSNFADFYLMIHYTLIDGSGTPLVNVIKSYDKTTDSKEMHRFVNVCVHYIDTYGEYEATNYIARAYKEIPEINKLMRLIRQSNEGGNIKSELEGFRREILNTMRFNIEKRGEKQIAKARASFNILIPILIQAIISAMAIYLEDIMAVTSYF